MPTDSVKFSDDPGVADNVPRHMRISNWVIARIRDGAFKPDSKIPSENELAEMFGVSRVTVRRALQTLESDDIIYRSQGLGSFVRDRRAPQSLGSLTDFSEDMRRAGMRAASKVTGFTQEAASARLAGILNVPENSLVYRVDRLRLGDDEPVAFDTTWLPGEFGKLIDPVEMQEKTIYEVLEKQHGIPVMRGCYRISAVNADHLTAHQLGVHPGDAVMLIARTTFTRGDRPVYYQKRFYRSDRIVYEMRVERDKTHAAGNGEMPLKEFVPVFGPD